MTQTSTSLKASRSRESGFSLLELVVAILIIGIFSLILSPAFNSVMVSQRISYREKQKLNNQLIAQGLLNYARYSTTLGSLPTPYTNGGGLPKNAVYDPSATGAAAVQLKTALTNAGIDPNEINTDNYPSARVRVYQLVTGLTQSVPLYFQSGPLVTLTYQFGAVYQTACPAADTTCNPNTATGIPGDSSVLTSTNYSSWSTTGTDLPAVLISSLNLQKQMLATTSQRLDKVRDKLIDYKFIMQKNAAPTDTTNWYPAGSPSQSGGNPSTNQGCRDGWYNLATDTQIIPTLGMSSAEFGSTAWGGAIQYCRDYDPLGTKGANTPPYFGALRINKSVSQGIAPDSSVVANNILLTF